MMENILHAGIGGKKKVIYVDIKNVYLDPQNPRLPEEAQGKSESILLEKLYEAFDLEELALSMAQNGYFDEEPIVVITKSKPKSEDNVYTVVEGNRRIATIKILLDSKKQNALGIKSWPSLDAKVVKDLSSIPAILYDNREEVLPYLGVRHIAGIKKWDAYAKARYIASMIQAGHAMEEIQRQIGDRQNSARKHYLCYQLAEQVKNEFDFDLEPVKNNFSYLMLATGQGSIKRFIGISTRLDEVDLEEPVPADKLPSLKNLFSLIFGEGKQRPSVLDESRDITNYLSHVIASPKATEFLIKTRELKTAYELSDGEEEMVKRFLAKANQKLDTVLGIVHRHKTPDVREEIRRCSETVERLVDAVAEEKKK